MTFEMPLRADSGPLTFKDVADCAARLSVDPHVLWAVALTESDGAGYLPSGRLKILFEGHVFWKRLMKNGIDPAAYLPGDRDILYPAWTKKFYKGGEGEYARLYRACAIDEDAALCSASYGAFQVLGGNYADLGWPDVKSFVLRMAEGCAGQMEIFAEFLRRKKLLPAIRARAWQEIARVYNGPRYAENGYHVKMAVNYRQSLQTNGGAK